MYTSTCIHIYIYNFDIQTGSAAWGRERGGGDVYIQGTHFYSAVWDGCVFVGGIMCADYVRLVCLIMCGLCAGFV